MKNIPKTLKNVDLSRENGEVLALMGKNGACKSTLMNILFGALQTHSVKIYVERKEAFLFYEGSCSQGNSG